MKTAATGRYADEFERRSNRQKAQRQQRIARAIHDIGLALNATHNTVTTDLPGAKPVKDQSWRVNHRKELKQLRQLQALLCQVPEERL